MRSSVSRRSVSTGFGDVIARAGIDAFLAVAFHRLGGQRDDRQLLEAIHFPNRAHGFVAVHLRQHDVHQDEIDPSVLSAASSIAALPVSAERTSIL